MFPEIMRDEVFRLETAQSWLRWPMVSDADAVASTLSQSRDCDAAVLAIVPRQAALCLVERWRSDNEAGHVLRLLIVPKAEPTRPLGSIGIEAHLDGETELSFALRPEARRREVLIEAADALVNAAFLFGAVDELVALTSVDDVAAQDMLRRVGFVYSGASMGWGASAPTQPRDRFTLDRADWLRGGSLQPGRFKPLEARLGLEEAR